MVEWFLFWVLSEEQGPDIGGQRPERVGRLGEGIEKVIEFVGADVAKPALRDV